jgi:hypothetical protein
MAHVGEELGFVLARFGKLAAFILNFIEEPHIFDCNRGLIGKG